LKSFIYLKYLTSPKLILFLILLSSFNSINFAQTRVDSLEYLGRFLKLNLFNTRFDKLLNTFNLNSQFQFVEDSENWLVRLNENFSSSYIRNERNSTRDEQHLNLNAKYAFNKNIYLGFLGNSSILSDNRSLGINESAVNFATLYSELRPIDNFGLAPFGGYSSNRQIGITDLGPVYGIEGLLEKFLLSDLEINSVLRFKNEDVLPRRNLIRYYGLSVLNNFDKGVSNKIETKFTQSRKDFYLNYTSNLIELQNSNPEIQSRTETAYLLQDRLFYDQFLNLFSLDLTGGLNWRRIDRDTRFHSIEQISTSTYDTKIEELKLEVDALSRYTSKNLNFTLRANYSERDEKNSPKRSKGISESLFDQQSEREAQKNNNSVRAILALIGSYRISNKDFLTFSLYQSKLKYDTPSPLNDDDRDEILSIIKLGYLSRINPYFSAFINLEGTYNHIVYIYASRSSNNNQNRIIKLKTGGEYDGSVINSFNSFEVSANYTVYDFEELSSNFRSFSFRQFTAIDSTTIYLIDDVSLFNYAYLKLSEIGDFRWNSFTSLPTRFLKELYLEPRFVLNKKNSIFSMGLRFFLLDTYGYVKSDKVLESSYLSIGPTAIIDLQLWQKLDLIFRGYYEFISNTNYPEKEQASLAIQVNWKF
jgi:hypothetical protein